ncbi:YdeI/OmpD-associated family protein [Aquimarina sp. 2-A2]|uniref:YdeI/OmpD-associated family protein n=1 Tax=Aquimarina sp. 2-A2 TaxID=3382644 RepID=UPI00387F2387
MKKYTSVEAYIESHEERREALELLRKIMLSTSMDETMKWGAPVYTIDKKNVIGLGAFKSYVGIWFYQGVFLTDPKQVLVNAQEDKTRGLRQWRFEGLDDIDSNLVKLYVEEAIFNQKQGKEIKIVKSVSKTLIIPEILKKALSEDAILSEKFEAFTFFKQKEFTEYIDSAKRETTQEKRVAKIIPMILVGIGLNDKYR